MANGADQPRRERWAGISAGVVQGLILDDLDRGESSFEQLREDIRGLKRMLTGLLISITTAAVLLALNLGVGK